MAINTQEVGQTADRRGRAAIPGLMATNTKAAGRRALEPNSELFKGDVSLRLQSNLPALMSEACILFASKFEEVAFSTSLPTTH